MNALVVCQPYASAMFQCGKDVENRSWKLPLGPLAIVAGKSRIWMNYAKRLIPAAVKLMDPLKPWENLPYGAILGIVEVVEVWDYDECPDSVLQNPWAFGPWCNMLDNPKPLPSPIPWRGSQRIFHIPDSIILEQFGQTSWLAGVRYDK